MDIDSIAIGILVGFILGGFISNSITKASYRTDAIERGHALYCPDNGKFEWVGECDE